MDDNDREDRLAAFDTTTLLRAVDDLDRMRAHLDGDGYKPPEIRNELLRLHQLAMPIVNEGLDDRRAQDDMFALAFDIESQLDDIADAFDRLRETIAALVTLAPED